MSPSMWVPGISSDHQAWWQALLSAEPLGQSQNMNVFKDRCFENLKNVGNWYNIATVAKIFFYGPSS